jgi:hypothetical protein
MPVPKSVPTVGPAKPSGVKPASIRASSAPINPSLHKPVHAFELFFVEAVILGHKLELPSELAGKFTGVETFDHADAVFSGKLAFVKCFRANANGCDRAKAGDDHTMTHLTSTFLNPVPVTLFGIR